MKNYYEHQQQIASTYVDHHCELNVYQASLLMQDAMTELFYQYKCDAVRLSHTHFMVWAVARSRIHFDRVPVWMETVRIRAFPVKISPVTIHINILVDRPDGTPLLRCRQELFAMDIRDHSLRRVDSTPFPVHMELLPAVVKEPFCRMKVAARPEEQVYSHTIRAMDTDMNRHMNNAAYIRLAMDAFPVSFWENWEVDTFDIHYASEGKEGETLQIYQKTEGAEARVLIQSGERVLCAACFHLRIRKERERIF